MPGTQMFVFTGPSSSPFVEMKGTCYRAAEQSAMWWRTAGGLLGMKHFQVVPAMGSELMAESDSSSFSPVLPASPQDTVVNAQVKTSFHGTEELATEEPRVRDYFIAHVYGSQLWDSKIG